MQTIGIFFGSDTGNTESIAYLICNALKPHNSQVYDIANSSKEKIEKFNILLFGIPTWYYGEMQCDWEDFLPTFKKINFNNKIIGLFGCGDQEDYSEYFCNAMGTIYNLIKHHNNVYLIGEWSTKGYLFDESKAVLKNDHFCGLTLDEDRQPEKTKFRIMTWTKQIINEIHVITTNN
ncbi:MAG: flavodoxin FldA [Buchnera aphidicola (Eriosoma harunire)]